MRMTGFRLLSSRLSALGSLACFATVIAAQALLFGVLNGNVHLRNDGTFLQNETPCETLSRTHKWNPTCHDELEDVIVLPALITGTSLSALRYVHDIFSRAGTTVSIDIPGPGLTVSWRLGLNETRFAEIEMSRDITDGLQQDEQIEGDVDLYERHVRNIVFRKVLHQVRCPVEDIASIAKRSERWFLICEKASGITGLSIMTPLERAARTYLWFNSFVQSFADSYFKIEDAEWFEICLAAGFERDCDQELFQMAERETLAKLTQSHVRIQEIEGIDAALAYDIRSLAARYGYGASCLEQGEMKQ